MRAVLDAVQHGPEVSSPARGLDWRLGMTGGPHPSAAAPGQLGPTGSPGLAGLRVFCCLLLGQTESKRKGFAFRKESKRMNSNTNLNPSNQEQCTHETNVAAFIN